jgi:glutamyl-tRNA synthetase
MSVRVRYAPSPTGLQHIGGLRTALFNYLFAKANGGKFYLRLEDTDQGRYNAEAEADLYESLRWAGLEWDEGPDKNGPFGPYVQSKRLELYTAQAKTLVDSGHAYECFCSPQRLDALRQEQEKAKLPSGYDRHCRHLTAAQKDAERAQAAAEGRRPVVRFAMPSEGTTAVVDVILGRVEKANTDLPVDPVILKSDGFPTYHLAHIVDDHAMETSHVLRAQEWLPSAFLHVLMFRASGYEVPKYVHLPLIMGQDGQKLSKRHGSTSVRQFREQGYLPQALVNYLALLGWSYDDSREFFTLDELSQVFTLERLSKSPAVFDYKKLEHFNASYIRALGPDELVGLLAAELAKAGLVAQPASASDRDRIAAMAPLVRERLTFVAEAPSSLKFVFADVAVADAALLVPKKGDRELAARVLTAALPLVDGLDARPAEDTEALFRAKAEELGVKLGDFMHPVRVAVSGGTVSPPMFGSMNAVGEARVRARLEAALKLLA